MKEKLKIYSDNLLKPEQINIGTIFYRTIEDSEDGYKQCEVFYVSEIFEDDIFTLVDIEDSSHTIRMNYSEYITKDFIHLNPPGDTFHVCYGDVEFDLSAIMNVEVMKQVIHTADPNLDIITRNQIIMEFVSNVFRIQLDCSLEEYLYDEDNYNIIDDDILLNIVQQSNTNKIIQYYELFDYDPTIDLSKIKLNYFRIWSWKDGKAYLMIYIEGEPVGRILQNISDPEIDDILSLFTKKVNS